MILLLSSLCLAGAFDHDYAALDGFYEGAVHSDGVDYGALAKRRDKLDAVLTQVAGADVSGFDDGQKLALYINAYNAYTLAAVLDAMPIASIMELDGGKLWDTRKFRVAGEELTLNQLENERIRKLGDARIHAAVNCASKGCPPLQPDPIRPATLDAQLTAAATAWVGGNAYSQSGRELGLSQVFDWYAPDFEEYGQTAIPGLEGKQRAAVGFLAAFSDEDTARELRAGGWTARFTEYDWKLNKR